MACEELKVTAPSEPLAAVENSPLCGKVVRTCVVKPLTAVTPFCKRGENIAERYRHQLHAHAMGLLTVVPSIATRAWPLCGSLGNRTTFIHCPL